MIEMRWNKYEVSLASPYYYYYYYYYYYLTCGCVLQYRKAGGMPWRQQHCGNGRRSGQQLYHEPTTPTSPSDWHLKGQL